MALEGRPDAGILLWAIGDVPDLPDAGEEVLDIPGPDPLTELHAEDGPGVSLLRSEWEVWGVTPHIPDMELIVGSSGPDGGDGTSSSSSPPGRPTPSPLTAATPPPVPGAAPPVSVCPSVCPSV